MAMDDSILERIEKQMEGTGLAMAAVAEVLQKMDGRLAKAEDEDEEDKEREEEIQDMQMAAMEKATLVKMVANEVVGIFKDGQYSGERGMDVGPDPATKAKAEKSADIGGVDADDSEKAVTIDSKTENVQHTIQAMQLQLSQIAKEMDDMDTDEDDDENGSEEDIESGYYGKLENMQKQILELTKAVQTGNSIESAVARETDSRLRKMGFKEETSLQRPTQIHYDSLGLDGSTPIMKSDNSSGDAVVDQLTNLSYKQLRDMQIAIENGQTDGVPVELLQ